MFLVREAEQATFSKRKRGGSRQTRDMYPFTATTHAASSTPRPPTIEEDVAAYTGIVPKLSPVSHASVDRQV